MAAVRKAIRVIDAAGRINTVIWLVTLVAALSAATVVTIHAVVTRLTTAWLVVLAISVFVIFGVAGMIVVVAIIGGGRLRVVLTDQSVWAPTSPGMILQGNARVSNPRTDQTFIVTRFCLKRIRQGRRWRKVAAEQSVLLPVQDPLHVGPLRSLPAHVLISIDHAKWRPISQLPITASVVVIDQHGHRHPARLTFPPSNTGGSSPSS